MNADESLRLNDSQAIQAKANLSVKSSHEIDMSVDDSLVLNDIRNIFETSTSSSEFIITKPLKSECAALWVCPKLIINCLHWLIHLLIHLPFSSIFSIIVSTRNGNT